MESTPFRIAVVCISIVVSQRAAPAQDFVGLVSTTLKTAGTGPHTPRHLVSLLAASLRRLGAAVSLPSHEQLIVIDTDGGIVRVVDGTIDSLKLDSTLENLFNQPESKLVVIHNHPASSSLSIGDIAQLSKPGVRAVIAIGHDGSVYGAAVGEQWKTRLLRPRVIPIIGTELTTRLAKEWRAAGFDALALAPHLSHLVALGFRDVRIIDYQFVLASSRDASLAQWHDLSSRVLRPAVGGAWNALRRLELSAGSKTSGYVSISIRALPPRIPSLSASVTGSARIASSISGMLPI